MTSTGTTTEDTGTGPAATQPAESPVHGPVTASDEEIARLLNSDDLFKPTRAERNARMPTALRVTSTALSILSTVMLGFAVYAGFVSRLHHDRAQLTAYADFRVELAWATAPNGPARPNDPGQPLAMGASVAVLEIPRLGMKEVVFEGTSSAVLQNGPGHMRSTVLPGQSGVSVIMGRSTLYGGPFGSIATLAPNDTLTVTTGQGVHDYRVLGVRRAGDAQPPLFQGRGRLTLMTADGNPFVASDMIRVDADLTSPVQPRPRVLIPASALRSQAEQPMAGDRLALVPLVIVGVALVLAASAVGWIRYAWGGPQTWLVAVPVLTALGIGAADQAVRLLPNLI